MLNNENTLKNYRDVMWARHTEMGVVGIAELGGSCGSVLGMPELF